MQMDETSRNWGGTDRSKASQADTGLAGLGTGDTYSNPMHTIYKGGGFNPTDQ